VKEFSYLRPQSLGAAAAALAEHAEAQVIAGGQTLLLAMKERRATPSVLVSLRDVDEVRGVSDGEDGALRVGAATTYWELRNADLRPAHSLLATVAADVADVPVQRMGTLGGALCLPDPTYDMPVAALALDAEVELASTGSTRRLPVGEFIQGPHATALVPGEMMTALHFPAAPEPVRSAFVKHRLRRFDSAIVAVACVLTLDDDGHVERVRIAYGAVAPVPLRATAAEKLLAGEQFTDQVAREAGELAVAALEGTAADGFGRFPFDYRRDVLPALVARALRAAAGDGKE
jgi:carbon-monoxide dehydrogenase medium subunit